MQINEVKILLGSNLGDRAAYLLQATEMISLECGIVICKSFIYETEPWGLNDVPSFLNQIIQIHTQLTPHTLLDRLLSIEQILGRQRITNGIYNSRTIDLDILYYNEQIINNQNLIIPHPRLHLRKFTLIPLVELWPDFMHPILLLTHKELLLGLDDDSNVKIFSTSLSD